MGQGNKKKGFGRAKGYGPGSGRGWGGSGIGGNVGGGFGKGNTSSTKGGGGGGNNSWGSNLFNSISSWLGGSAYAQGMGDVTGKLKQLATPSDWKIKQFADKNIDITNTNPSFRIGIDTQRAINSVKDENTRTWLNKWVPDKVKSWNINHQMYSPTKVMPGDPGYNPTGTGSPALDPNTQAYLDWAAKVNPTAMTVADAEKLYAKQIAEGSTLERAMRFNKAETGSFYALIPNDEKQTTDTVTDTVTDNVTDNVTDTAETSTPKNNTMTTFTNNDLNNLYQSILGRDVKKEGMDYWQDQYTKATEGGKSSADAIQSIKDSILASDERKDLGLGTTLDDPNAARHRVEARKSIARGDGVRAGTVASYSDMFNADGTKKDDWVDVETWNQNRIAAADAEIANLKANPQIKTVTEYVDRWHQADTSKYDKQISDLKKTITEHETDYDALMEDYKSTKLGYDSLYAQAAYGNKPQNLTVKGVRTQNELPGYQPKTSGTGSFNRKSWMTPLAKSAALTIGSLNLA